ncbi:hypothetical protein NO2_1732, partial [Candidatus Termititenax persephonae]
MSNELTLRHGSEDDAGLLLELIRALADYEHLSV